MRVNSKIACLAAVTLLPIIGVGCSGINTSHSVSPATFLLPGLLQNEQRPAAGQPAVEPPRASEVQPS